MSEVQALIRHYAAVRSRLRNPPNAVPDTGINLKRDKSPKLDQPPKAPPELKISLTPIQQSQLKTCQTFLDRNLTFKKILIYVADEFYLSYEEIISRDRRRFIVLPRQISLWLGSRNISNSLVSIGKFLNLDHTTVIHSRDRINALISKNHLFSVYVLDLEVRLRENFSRPAIPAIDQQPMAVEPGPSAQVQTIFPVDNAIRSTFFEPKAWPHQDVEGTVCGPTTAIQEISKNDL